MFEPVVLRWQGKSITVAPERVLGAIATVEEFITIADLATLRNKPPIGRIAQAYTAVLRYAGVEVDGSKVYAAICDSSVDGVEITTGITAMLEMMIPDHLKVQSVPPVGKSKAGRPRGSRKN